MYKCERKRTQKSDALGGQKESPKNRQCLGHNPERLSSMKFCWELGSNSVSNATYTFFL